VLVTSEPGPESEEERLHALLQRRLEAAGGCVSRQEAVAMARQAFRDLELADWRIDVETEGADWDMASQCAAFGQFQDKPILLVVPEFDE
jgi:hypothetical protein